MADPVAQHVARLINRLITTYVAFPEHFHLIGFGLGAHIAGISTNYVDRQIQRITGELGS